MPEPRHLKNAPITEAIIDFRVKARPDLKAIEFAHVRSQLADRFPKLDERRGFEATVELGRGGSRAAARDLGLQGYFFKSADEKKVVQFRIDGFTFNKLRPYTKWEDIFPQAMEIWQLFWRVARPEVVTRLALRYINHIPLPPTLKDYDDYLRASPPIPPELPQYLSGFLSRITVHDPETDVAANIAQALETNPVAGTITVILDIDAYKQGEYSPEEPAIAETFQQLRRFKNDIFFNSLTDKTLRLFE